MDNLRNKINSGEATNVRADINNILRIAPQVDSSFNFETLISTTTVFLTLLGLGAVVSLLSLLVVKAKRKKIAAN
ncbi:hypothetical protein ACJA23_01935 [Mycoplasma corogypsi]|uniref:hypothetical protein n=1 Tax=Mycoplasma corogypsi TaxID=2106 RepID=UPI003873B40C